MTRDQRLLDHLDALRVALGAHLRRLHALWAEPGGSQWDEIERLLVAVGTTPTPTERETAAGRRLRALRSAPDSRLAAISHALELDLGEEVLAAAVWWAESDQHIATLLGYANDDAARRFATASLLRRLMAPLHVDVPASLDDRGVLVEDGVLEPGAGAGGALALTSAARAFLAGGTPRPFAAPAELPARLRETRDALAWHLEDGARGVVLLRGGAGTGRRALAVAAIRTARRIPVGADHAAPELRLLARLGVAVPVATIARLAELGWEPTDPPAVAWAGPTESHPDAYVVDVPAPSDSERTAHWATVLAAHGVDPAPARRLAHRFRLSDAEVGEVVARAAVDGRRLGRALDVEGVWAAARRHPRHALGAVAALMAPGFTFDDLVLPKRVHRELRELVAHITLQDIVLDGWGFGRRMPRGTGVAALLTGPPGTGKTTAAEAIASELCQDLYRIDLSAVVSKYVGETEKNLALAFDAAERASAILFFDEADSLFGRRTEVRDAHDRYANLEINYLLQRVETSTGLVLLATNREAAIDEAFLRRLRFIVRLPQPDAALRRELWRRAFPPDAEVAELDWDALAALELTGGTIQAAALSAAFSTAAGGGAVTMQRIGAALAREYDKLGRAWRGFPERVAA